MSEKMDLLFARMKSDLEMILTLIGDLKDMRHDIARLVELVSINNKQAKPTTTQSPENESMRLSLTINGVPEKNDENLQDIYDDIAKNIGFSSPPPRVSLFRYSDASRAPTFVARFRNFAEKNDFKFKFMKVAKTLTICQLSGFNDEPDTRIYVQDQMSKSTYELMRAAIKFKYKKLLSNVMVDNCRIFAKLSPNSPKLNIHSITQLNLIVNYQI